MNLAAGTTRVHYRITAERVAGGMGEVWRATNAEPLCSLGRGGG